MTDESRLSAIGRAAIEGAGLGEPVKSFDETFKGETVVMAHFFPSGQVAPQNERTKLAEQINELPHNWLPGVGQVVNITFDLAQRDLIVAALRANR